LLDAAAMPRKQKEKYNHERTMNQRSLTFCQEHLHQAFWGLPERHVKKEAASFDPY